jgi:hypothetical protein
VNVLVTIVLISALALWTAAVYGRLVQRRDQVRQAWARLEVNQSNEAIRTVYNKHVDQYNAALAAFPANIIGAAAGFKTARHY